MAKKIGQYAVHLTGDDGQLHSFLPGTEVPDWAAKRLGDHCFEGGEDLFNDKGVPAPVVHGDAIVPDTVVEGPPPRAGKGSGEQAWRDYAEKQGLDVSDVEGRDNIIAALEDEDIAVE